MKPLLVLIVGLMVVGCGKTETCYWCKEPIKEAALICKHCGENPKEPAPDVKGKAAADIQLPSNKYEPVNTNGGEGAGDSDSKQKN